MARRSLGRGCFRRHHGGRNRGCGKHTATSTRSLAVLDVVKLGFDKRLLVLLLRQLIETDAIMAGPSRTMILGVGAGNL